jgi:uncharacterized protein (DUF885 family)
VSSASTCCQAPYHTPLLCTWPGQATGYYVAYLEIARLRAEAERRLGARFEIRAFHDRVLEDGALPMPALAAKIERWIASAPPG